jgi:hypothetical protein
VGRGVSSQCQSVEICGIETHSFVGKILNWSQLQVDSTYRSLAVLPLKSRQNCCGLVSCVVRYPQGAYSSSDQTSHNTFPEVDDDDNPTLCLTATHRNRCVTFDDEDLNDDLKKIPSSRNISFLSLASRGCTRSCYQSPLSPTNPNHNGFCHTLAFKSSLIMSPSPNHLFAHIRRLVLSILKSLCPPRAPPHRWMNRIRVI